jgi:acyl-CoA dehydrogenase
MTDVAASPEQTTDVVAMAREVGNEAGPFAAGHDRDGSFVVEGYAAIRRLGYGTIAVPRELGGGGHGLRTVCQAQAALARRCANTALAIAMHQHNILTLAWRWRRGATEVEPFLRRVVSEGLVLCSSGAMDLANPGVSATTVDGGFLVRGRKGYASGCPGSDLLVTLAAVEDQPNRPLISVFLPMHDPGVRILADWDAMGMRGSGSNGVEFTDVFVPESSVLRRGPTPVTEAGPGSNPGVRNGPRPTGGGARRAVRLPGLLIALPVIGAVYLGIAGGVRDEALRLVAGGRHAGDPATMRLAGLMTQELRSGWWALEGVLRTTTDDSLATEAQFVNTMLAKRQAILGSISVVETAMEMLGGVSYNRTQPFEQALRDVRAGITHPLPPDATLIEVGRSALARMANEPQAT